ncbi:hypothetical protein TraAM80_08244 [Trypanosoma rangeli]|uniref:Uncharacterized protein n=1 Tax=Trypanosoma rangeli TaxID=5698 RepID=A0A3R7M4L9_TRYRA|nr:uncharacterized protein TraAM80_08244 [Trypanosoma rangeli]RNE99333.1 hypothetical protein TraAM80_08244 [Trypanosoma rangeli]|eukprot:RNE99333.1 hypothetical protein TraAM80_08244 [Trypanosoma rangeli]
MELRELSDKALYGAQRKQNGGSGVSEDPVVPMRPSREQQHVSPRNSWISPSKHAVHFESSPLLPPAADGTQSFQDPEATMAGALHWAVLQVWSFQGARRLLKAQMMPLLGILGECGAVGSSETW